MSRTRQGKINSAGRGFTLIEALVALGITAVLAVVITPIVLNFAGEARIAAANLTAKSFKNALVALHTAELATGGGFYANGGGYWFAIQKNSEHGALESGISGFDVICSVNNFLDVRRLRDIHDIFNLPIETVETAINAAFESTPEHHFIVGYVDGNAVLKRVFYFPDDNSNQYTLIKPIIKQNIVGDMLDKWDKGLVEIGYENTIVAFAGRSNE